MRTETVGSEVVAVESSAAGSRVEWSRDEESQANGEARRGATAALS